MPVYKVIGRMILGTHIVPALGHTHCASSSLCLWLCSEQILSPMGPLAAELGDKWKEGGNPMAEK